MTREEAIARLEVLTDYEYYEDLEALDIAIKALEQQPCDDCISRQAVLDAIDVKAWEFCDYLIREGRNDEQQPVSHFADNLRECVGEDLPPVTPKGKTGKWKEVYAETDYRNGWIEFSCENCEYQHGLESGQYGWSYGDPIPWKYCPICGARMVEPQESEDKE